MRILTTSALAMFVLTIGDLAAQPAQELAESQASPGSQHTCEHGTGHSEPEKGEGMGASCPMHANGHGGETHMGSRGSTGGGAHMGRMGRMGSGGGMAHGNAMRTAMTLVHEHRDAIEREVEDIPNGVITTTWSAIDAEAARMLERHVIEMKAALDKGETVRGWDPLFAEIFQHYDEIEMVIETIEGGVRVTETSDNPEVVKLIQAHARKVNEFLERGPAAVHEETPLPEGYVDTRPQ